MTSSLLPLTGYLHAERAVLVRMGDDLLDAQQDLLGRLAKLAARNGARPCCTRSMLSWNVFTMNQKTLPSSRRKLRWISTTSSGPGIVRRDSALGMEGHCLTSP